MTSGNNEGNSGIYNSVEELHPRLLLLGIITVVLLGKYGLGKRNVAIRRRRKSPNQRPEDNDHSALFPDYPFTPLILNPNDRNGL